jgi:hypothetical protein
LEKCLAKLLHLSSQQIRKVVSWPIFENAHRGVDRVPVNQCGAIHFGNGSEPYACPMHDISERGACIDM